MEKKTWEKKTWEKKTWEKKTWEKKTWKKRLGKKDFEKKGELEFCLRTPEWDAEVKHPAPGVQQCFSHVADRKKSFFLGYGRPSLLRVGHHRWLST